MNSSNKAEDLMREVIDYYSKVPDAAAEERNIKTKDELINFYLKKEKYEVCLSHQSVEIHYR